MIQFLKSGFFSGKTNVVYAYPFAMKQYQSLTPINYDNVLAVYPILRKSWELLNSISWESVNLVNGLRCKPYLYLFIYLRIVFENILFFELKKWKDHFHHLDFGILDGQIYVHWLTISCTFLKDATLLKVSHATFARKIPDLVLQY